MTNDDAGDLLRQFYQVYGRPEEGPPQSINVGQLFQNLSMDQSEMNILREALKDRNLQRQFSTCQIILDDLATRLTSDELLRDLSPTNLSARDFEELYSRTLWFSLAATLDKRDGILPLTPFDDQVELPLPVKIQMTIHGSLVIRLYIALVCMREGILSRLIDQNARGGSRCCQQIRSLLNSDYIRRIRNALSHGTFSSCIAGLVFRDDNGIVVATPGFLNWMSTWIMLINLQVISASI